MSTLRNLLVAMMAFGLLFSSTAHADENQTPLQQKRQEARELSERLQQAFPESDYYFELQADLNRVIAEIEQLKTGETVVSEMSTEAPRQDSLTPAQLRAQKRRLRISPVRLRIKRKAEQREAAEMSQYTETGAASYYADRFHGKNTASGEPFLNHELTAAHRTLPFGSQVKVTSLASGNSVVVTITDRGPYVEGRILDLSQAAFEALEPLSRGVINIEMEVIDLAK